ncbi:hypothetical protein [Shewanella algae]|uniref:hypothetical protein n=1 Tax=Shewanella algae TaxID=38313 RepID=UPI003007D9CF
MTTTPTKDIPNRALRNLIIRAQLLSGAHPQVLAKKWDLEPSTIRRLGNPSSEIRTRQRHGLPVPEHARTTIDESNHDRLIREARMLFRTTRMTRAAIAKRLNCCVNILRDGGAFAETTFD